MKRRRHGPDGYQKYESYRPWLRDEFSFRCVYCLERESWTKVIRAFEIDHIVPQALKENKVSSYQNLVYACSRCNGVKSMQVISNPSSVLVEGQVKVFPNGTVEGYSKEAQRLILQLDLNSDLVVEWRKLMMEFERLNRMAELKAKKVFCGFPNDLPNLRKLRPPKNKRPEGINESWFAINKRNELPGEY